MEFVFMLTRGDRTVENGLEVLEEIAPLGLAHIGFKDIGVPPETLRRLTAAIRRSGARVYMEVVSDGSDAARRSAALGRELAVDCLLGGTQVAETLRLLEGSAVTYYPFAGRPSGHPTRLGGSPGSVEADAMSFVSAGCAGCDLLAYRATEADPLELVRAARRGVGAGKLIVAGSVSSGAQVRALAAAGADAFTIGSAIFKHAYAPSRPSLKAQLEAVLEDCRQAASAN